MNLPTACRARIQLFIQLRLLLGTNVEDAFFCDVAGDKPLHRNFGTLLFYMQKWRQRFL